MKQFEATFCWDTSPKLALQKISLTLSENRGWRVATDKESKHALELTKAWWESYMAGKQPLMLPLGRAFSPFQKQVFDLLLKVPRGTTVCYSELAERLGRPTAARAVARALASNPYPLLIPCHRVIGKNGKLCGFREGLDVKQVLLDYEL